MLKITEPLLLRNDCTSRGATSRYIDESREIVMVPKDAECNAEDEQYVEDNPFETGQIVRVFVQDFMCHRKFTVRLLRFRTLTVTAYLCTPSIG